MSILITLAGLIFLFKFSLTQSTCPVQQGCKCGIKIDGHIYIYCARKQLDRLPKFTRSSILYDELILSGNQINMIQANSFSGLKVKRLLLDDNPLEFIEPNSFVELANYLEELIVSVNTESMQSTQPRPKISPILFQSLLNLKIIKLNGLDLDSLSMQGVLRQNTFNRTRKLEVIHLVDSGINRIELFSLNGVETSLKELNLDNNQLVTTNEIFNELKRMKRLQVLNLSRNRIRQLGRYQTNNLEFENEYLLSDLQLDLSFNGITSVDEYSFGITSFDSTSTGLVNSITKLNLNNNELNQFQLNFVTQLTQLRELSLDYNKIDFLPDNLFINSRRLEALSFKGNFIYQLKSEFVFSGLHFNLRRLNLASNKIRTVNKRVFMQVNKLRELNLEKNFLGQHFDAVVNNDLVNSFEGVESELRHLNLENNNLTPGHLWSLVNLLNLETLKIGNNNFDTLRLKSVLSPDLSEKFRLNKIFEFYRNLTYLDLQNSSLSQLPYFLGLNRTLTSLNLAQNHICSINGLNLKKFYFKLKSLNMNLNPLKCDCNMIKFRHWIDDLLLVSTLSLPNYINTSSFEINTQSQNSQRDNSLKWKCLYPNKNRNKFLSDVNLNDLICEDSSENCELDEDEFTLKKSFSTTTKTSSTLSTLISVFSSTFKREDEIRIIESNPSNPTSMSLKSSTTKPVQKESKENIGLYLLNNQHQLLQRQSQSQSFFSSIELKQTLLGSFIGALSVILIVLVLVCLIKTTRHKLLGKDTSDNEKDKSTATNITNASTAPYELGKLSLQTLCINSTGCSSSGASTSSSCTGSTSGSQHTNTSCLCGMIHLEKQCLFTKMDPMRLTMLNCNRASVHQNYLNTNQLLAQIQMQNKNNLHYLASSLPYQSPDQSTSTSPTPYQLNEFNDDVAKNNQFNYFKNNSSLMNESNTYDKLHHQQRILNSNNSNSSLRAGVFSTKSNFSTLMPSHNFNPQNQIIASALSFHNQHMLNSGQLGEFINAAETTPFLIIQASQGLNNNELVKQELKSSTLKAGQNSNETQHTYHEIGDMLLNFSNGNMKTFNRNMNINNINSQQSEASSGEAKTSEMYI